MVRLVMDVDPALGIEGGDIDDALAMAFAFAHLDVLQVLAITVAGGNVSLPSAMLSARMLCQNLRWDVPLAAGASGPADRPLLTGHRHVVSDQAERWILDQQPMRAPSPLSALEVMASVADAGEFDILAVAPLSNVAAYLASHQRHRIRRIVTMGGWFCDADRQPEFNIATDPLAARAVYSSGIPMVVIPFDMTRRTRLRLDEIQPWRPLGPAGQMMYAGTENWIGMMARRFNLDGCHLHDPLAAAYCVHPELFQTRGIVPEIDRASGRTEIKAYDDSSAVRLVTDVDFPAFHDRFKQAILSSLRRVM